MTGAVRRLILDVLLVAVVAGCSPVPAGTLVPLLTGIPAEGAGGGCFTNFLVGTLNADPTYGTTISSEGGPTIPVMWRPGYTARRVGSQVTVLGPGGTTVAVTGNRYKIAGGMVSHEGTVDVFWACDFVIPT
jgi:hypothetical protein